MMMHNNLFVIICCLLVLFTPDLALGAYEVWGEFLPINQYFTVYDPEGNVILETGRKVYLQDQYLTETNKLYEIVEIDEENNTARAQFVEDVELEITSWPDLQKELGLTVAAAREKSGKIAIYHTHNAESYVPTDGTDSINGQGGIHKVGEAFVNALAALGIDVDYSERLHLPHDRGAYRRSRETALELLSHGPDAIFDVHRDAAPQNAYALQLQNDWITRVQFVVGRQNQNLGVNRQYAQSLKKIADDIYPGLVKGIFFGRGNYNQDLTPLSLLLEVGAHTNSRDAAEKGISLFAEIVDFYFYGPKAEAAQGGQKRVANRSVTGLILFVGTGLIIFYIINAGGFAASFERLKAFLKIDRLK